mgnify:CR=1 FL=1
MDKADRRFDPLTARERLVVAVVGLCASVWMFDSEKTGLMALMEQNLRGLRRDAAFDALAVAAMDLIAAKTVVDWSFATQKAAQALAPILRRDAAAALRDIPVET